MSPSIINFIYVMICMQISLTVLEFALVLAATLFVVIPEFGLQNVGRDRKALDQFMRESKHPLCFWSNILEPFGYWWISGPIFLYQRFVKHNTKSTFSNPLGRE